MENGFFADWFIYLAVVVGLGLVAFIWWFLPRWQLRKFHEGIKDPTDRADAEDKFRRTVGQILGGAAVLGGLALSLAELQTSRDAIRTQGESLLHQRLSQQFTKGLELLGKNSAAETYGGISALEQVAKASPEYHWPVINSLTNYVQFVSREKINIKPEKVDKVSPEVQAIMTVIGQRTVSQDGDGKIDLRSTYLTGIELVEANLQRALLDESILYRANLRSTDLSMTSLQFAQLENANLQGTNLQGANLTNAYMPGANLEQANLQGANLTKAILIAATGLVESQLREACSDGGTELPEGFDSQLKSCSENNK